MKIHQIFIYIVLVGIIILLLLNGCLQHRQLAKDRKIIEFLKNKKEVVIYKDKYLKNHAKIEVQEVPLEVIKQVEYKSSPEYYKYVKDSLIKQLKIKDEDIRSLTSIQGVLMGEIKANRSVIDEQKNIITEYESKYLKISTKEDSIGNKVASYVYDAKLDIVEYSKRKNIFSKEKYYIDISSPDKNFKIEGLEHYKREIKVKNKNLGIGLQIGYGIDEKLRFNRYIGLGLSYNLIRL